MSDWPEIGPIEEELIFTPEAVKKTEKELNTIIEAIGEIPSISGQIIAHIMKVSQIMAEFFWEQALQFAKPIVSQILTTLDNQFLKISEEGFNKTVERIGESFNLDRQSVEALKGFYQVIEGSGTIPSILVIVFGLMQLLTITNQANTGKIQQAIHADKRPFPADPGSTMRAAFLDPELSKRVWDLCRRNGLEDGDIELMFAAMYTLQDPGLIREIYFRKNPGKAWAENRLSEHGMTPERIKETMSVWPTIPSVQDILYLMGREAFEPDQIARFGLGADQPKDLVSILQLKGLDADWASKYWAAHWQQPALGNVFEMLHREQVNEDDIDEFFKVVETPPFWRERLKNIAYKVLTRVDVRRIHKMGVISDEQLIKNYMHQGYSRENAEIMSEFTVEYNESDQRALTKADILKAYEDRDLSFKQALVMLVEIGYREAAAGFYLSRVDLEMERAVRLEQIDLIKDKFLSNLSSEADTRNQLTAAGVVQKRINELLDRWKIIRIKNAKLPSKTDVDKMLKHGIINEAEYRKQMLILGYSEDYIEWFYQLATVS